METDTEGTKHLQRVYRWAVYVLVFVGISIFSVEGYVIWVMYQPKVEPNDLHCSDYRTRKDIDKAFKGDATHESNRGLDGDGDGIPCENRK